MIVVERRRGVPSTRHDAGEVSGGLAWAMPRNVPVSVSGPRIKGIGGGVLDFLALERWTRASDAKKPSWVRGRLSVGFYLLRAPFRPMPPNAHAFKAYGLDGVSRVVRAVHSG